MPKPKALTPAQAKRTIAHRFAGSKERPGIADRLRQLSTRFGLRSTRCFLVWTRFTGEHRGEGEETEIARVEILPTPRVSDSTAIARNPYSAGVLPVGALRVDQISAGAYTYDELRGVKIPGVGADEPMIPEDVSFFWEMVEDGRGDARPEPRRFRVLAGPSRSEGNVYQSILLDRISEDRNRGRTTNIGVDAAQLAEANSQDFDDDEDL